LAHRINLTTAAFNVKKIHTTKNLQVKWSTAFAIIKYCRLTGNVN